MRVLTVMFCFFLPALGYAFYSEQDPGREKKSIHPSQYSADQRHEIAEWKELTRNMAGMPDLPPHLGQKFVVARDIKVGEGQVMEPVADVWGIQFVYTVQEREAKELAENLASKYNMRVKSVRAYPGEQSSKSAVLIGSEQDAKRLSAEPSVRRVIQAYAIHGAGAEQFKQFRPRPEDAEKRRQLEKQVQEESKRQEAPKRPDDSSRQNNEESNTPESPNRTAAWNLDRIDTRARAYNQQFFANRSGQGVDIYVVDSGVYPYVLQGNEFINCPTPVPPNCGMGYSRVTLFRNGFTDATAANDDHGTAVAAIAAGQNYGVSILANIISVRIARIINTFPFVEFTSDQNIADFYNAIADRINSSPNKQAVVNMSFTISSNQITFNMLQALRRVEGTGASIVVAAGDTGSGRQSTDHTDYHPQNLISPSLIRVGMTDSLDRKFDFDLFFSPLCFCLSSTVCGRAVYHFTGSDIYAPGGYNMSESANCYVGEGISTRGGIGPFLATGTSGAAPHVTGVIANFLQDYRRARIKGKIAVDSVIKTATPNRVLVNGLRNGKMLYSGVPPGVHVNSTNNFDQVAPDSAVTAYANFGSAPSVVTIREPDTGAIFGAAIQYAASTQVNYVMPNIPPGQYEVETYDFSGEMSSFGALIVERVSPGLYMHPSQAPIVRGTVLIRDRNGINPDRYILVSRSGISWNPAFEDAYLTAYGTGFRHHNGIVSFQIIKGSRIWDNDGEFDVYYVGADPVYGESGLDTIVVGPLPAELIGKGTCNIKFYVNGTPQSCNACAVANLTDIRFCPPDC